MTLYPCPMCSGTMVVELEDDGYICYCDACGVSLPSYMMKNDINGTWCYQCYAGFLEEFIDDPLHTMKEAIDDGEYNLEDYPKWAQELLLAQRGEEEKKEEVIEDGQ